MSFVDNWFRCEKKLLFRILWWLSSWISYIGTKIRSMVEKNNNLMIQAVSVKIFEFSSNQNTLGVLVAMLNF